ncbi:hypothetical protein FPQ18DRAFT_402870 [Pyronema domesticum]|nr:hypothetical protein FPQ18DRAFT_402870 [Pyronema domesticum]
MHPKILISLQPPPRRVSVPLITILSAFVIGSFILSAQGSFIHDRRFVRRKEVAEEPKDLEGNEVAEAIEAVETTPATLCKNTGQIRTQEQCDQKSRDNTNMKITFAFSAVAFIGEMGRDDGEQPDETGQGEVAMGLDGMEGVEKEGLEMDTVSIKTADTRKTINAVELVSAQHQLTPGHPVYSSNNQVLKISYNPDSII